MEKFSLTENQKKAAKILAKNLKEKKWPEEELYQRLFKIPEEAGISQKEFFEAAYLVLLNNRRGPRLAQLIMGLGQKNAAKVIDERL